MTSLPLTADEALRDPLLWTLWLAETGEAFAWLLWEILNGR